MLAIHRKMAADFDQGKAADGRHTIKSTETCQKNDEAGECDGTTGYYTGGPFYGPFGITGLSNSRDDDLSDRHALVKPEFQMQLKRVTRTSSNPDISLLPTARRCACHVTSVHHWW